MSLIAELQRRNVFRVAAAYLALGWVVVQATDILVPALKLPEGLISTVVWIGVIGFPFALLFAWAYELTPEGLKREHQVDRNQSITQSTAKRLDLITIALLVVALGVFAFDRLVPNDASPGTPVDTAAAISVGAGHARDTNMDRAASPGLGQGPLPPQQQAPDDKSIAVLPFVNMSSDKEQEYFSDGISEELLNLLARIPELKVAARTSSFSFKGKDAEIAEIARRLNVAHVLEGSVRKSGNTVRITAQLIRAGDGFHLWSESWDRTLEDIFAVQDEIASAVAAQMKITLLGAAPRSRVTDPKAYALFLRGRALAEQFTPEGYAESSQLFEQVLAIDPEYLEAWRKLAANRFNEAGNGLRPTEEAYAQAREYLGKALAIDADFARGHDGLANIALNYDRDPATAAREWQRALALDPANPDILTNATALMQVLGQLDASIALTEWIAAGDPASALSQNALSYAYLLAGRLDDSIQASRTATSLGPGFLGARFNTCQALLLAGDAEAALAVIRDEPSAMWRRIGRVLAHHALGQQAESDAVLAELIEQHSQSATYFIAATLAWRGERDRAFEWLDKAVANHDGSLVLVVRDPLFSGLHDDPRWLPMLRKLGLAPEQLAAIPFEVKLPR